MFVYVGGNWREKRISFSYLLLFRLFYTLITCKSSSESVLRDGIKREAYSRSPFRREKKEKQNVLAPKRPRRDDVTATWVGGAVPTPERGRQAGVSVYTRAFSPCVFRELLLIAGIQCHGKEKKEGEGGVRGRGVGYVRAYAFGLEIRNPCCFGLLERPFLNYAFADARLLLSKVAALGLRTETRLHLLFFF